MRDHVKLVIQEFNPNHIILHVGTNELNSGKTIRQISRSIIDLTLSLKTERNIVTTFLTVPQKDSLNNNVKEVNCRFLHM